MMVAQGQVPITFLLSVLLHSSCTWQAITWWSTFNYIVKCLWFVMSILSIQTICNSINSSGNCLNQGSVLNDYYGSEMPLWNLISPLFRCSACTYAHTQPSELHIQLWPSLFRRCSYSKLRHQLSVAISPIHYIYKSSSLNFC